MTCPLCKTEQDVKKDKIKEGYKFNCRLCGLFKIYEDTLEDIADYINDNDRYFVSGYTRERKEGKGSPPILTGDNISLIINRAPKSPLDKADKILQNLSNMSEFPGALVNIDPRYDYPLGYCLNNFEFNYLQSYLKDAGLIKKPRPDSSKLTIKGWERVDKLSMVAGTTSQVFVAMNFEATFDSCYEFGIKPAIEEMGYKPYRIDREEHADRIDDKIMSEIRKSIFIVAEFTGQKHGVYFEAGYAFGLGIPVLWICREDDIKNLHFDTRQYNHINWSSENELKEKLINRIQVVIGPNR